MSKMNLNERIKLDAVILAGGFGTRIRHLYPDTPKPMIPVEGKPFLEWVIRYIGAQGVCRIRISTGFLSDKVESYFSKVSLPLHLSFHPEKEPLGTAGGFLNCIGNVRDMDYTLVLNGDSLVLFDLERIISLLNAEGKPEILLIGVKVEDASRFGQLKLDSDSNLVDFVEKRTGFGIINAGVYFLSSKCLEHFPKQRPLSFEEDMFPLFIRMGYRIRVQVIETPFIDMGVPSSLRQASSFIKETGLVNLT